MSTIYERHGHHDERLEFESSGDIARFQLICGAYIAVVICLHLRGAESAQALLYTICYTCCWLRRSEVSRKRCSASICCGSVGRSRGKDGHAFWSAAPMVFRDRPKSNLICKRIQSYCASSSSKADAKWSSTRRPFTSGHVVDSSLPLTLIVLPNGDSKCPLFPPPRDTTEINDL